MLNCKIVIVLERSCINQSGNWCSCVSMLLTTISIYSMLLVSPNLWNTASKKLLGTSKRLCHIQKHKSKWKGLHKEGPFNVHLTLLVHLMWKYAAIARNQLQRINKPLCITQDSATLSTAEAEPAVERNHCCDVRR